VGLVYKKLTDVAIIDQNVCSNFQVVIMIKLAIDAQFCWEKQKTDTKKNAHYATIKIPLQVIMHETREETRTRLIYKANTNTTISPKMSELFSVRLKFSTRLPPPPPPPKKKHKKKK
jgi:hypothetical protein